MYARVKDNEKLIRDIKTNSILNTDVNALKKHEIIMKQKEEAKRITQDIANIKNNISELNQLKNDVSELKDMMKILISREK